MPPPKKPTQKLPGLTAQLAQAGARQGLSIWVQQLAKDSSAERITNGEDLARFLGEDPSVRLTVVLKKGLKCVSGTVPREKIGAGTFVLQSDLGAKQIDQNIRYQDVALFFVQSTGKLATG